MPMRRLLKSSALALVAAGAWACTDFHAPSPGSVATTPELAAATLGTMADEARLEGDTAGAAAYTDAQVAVASSPRAGTLRVTQGETTEDWRAVAYRTRVPATCPAVPTPTSPAVCRAGGGPSLVAWSTVRPERMLMISAPEGSSVVPGAAGPLPPAGTAMVRVSYVDRSVSLPLPVLTPRPGTSPGTPPAVPIPWLATAGSISQLTTTDATGCPAGTAAPMGGMGRCLQGRSSVRFTLDVALPAIPSVAAQVRRLSAPETAVPAVVWQLDSVPTRGTGTGPGIPTAPPLASRLEAVRSATGQEVSLRLTVRNVSNAVQVLGYANGQRAEFEATGAAGTAWRWGASQMFTQAVGVDTLAPGAERRYEATWPRPTRGAWVMRAGTVNTTGPRASSVAPLVVP